MSAFLEYFVDQIRKNGVNVFSVSAYEGDQLETVTLAENNPCQNIDSVAKAFTATAIGLLADRGMLDVEEKVTDILGADCPEDAHPYWQDTTVHMVLKHQLGLPKNFLDIDSFDARAFGRDYLKYMLTYPLTCPAGGEKVYTDGAYYLLARMVEKRAGESLDNFMWRELFFPLGFREAAWSHCPMGHAMGATGLYIRSEDMAKLGKLYLNGGVWEKQRLLSRTWVDTVLQRGYELVPREADPTAYGKGGMRGQMLMVLPEKNRVVAWQGFVTEKKVNLEAIAAAFEG